MALVVFGGDTHALRVRAELDGVGACGNLDGRCAVAVVAQWLRFDRPGLAGHGGNEMEQLTV